MNQDEKIKWHFTLFKKKIPFNVHFEIELLHYLLFIWQVLCVIVFSSHSWRLRLLQIHIIFQLHGQRRTVPTWRQSSRCKGRLILHNASSAASVNVRSVETLDDGVAETARAQRVLPSASGTKCSLFHPWWTRLFYLRSGGDNLRYGASAGCCSGAGPECHGCWMRSANKATYGCKKNAWVV